MRSPKVLTSLLFEVNAVELTARASYELYTSWCDAGVYVQRGHAEHLHHLFKISNAWWP